MSRRSFDSIRGAAPGLRLAVLVALALLAALAAGRPARAQSAPTVMVAQDATLGAILTDPNGMTLYILTRDSPGVSTCSGGCLSVWPALAPPAGDLTLPDGVGGTLAVITRDDGAQQVTYNDMPLYFFARDMNPGDASGNGVAGFMVAMPQPAM